MEKKICEICQKEFETEDLEQTLCDECKLNVAGAANEADVNEAEEVIAEEVYEAKENAEADEISEIDEQAEGEEVEIGEEALAEGELSEDELALLEEEGANAEKKKKTIKIVSIACAIAALIAVVLFVPFKKDSAADKRVNLFTSLQSAIVFNNEQSTAMIIGDEKIDKALYNYFYERAQYNLLIENISQDATADEINSFWDKEIDGRNTKEIAVENAKKDIIQFVVGKQQAEKAGIKMSDEEKESLEQYMNAYITDEFLEQMKLTKEQVSYILEGSTLTSKLAEKIVEEDEKYNVADADIEKSIKDNNQKISAKHILFNTIDQTTYQPLTDDELDKVKKLAEDTLAKIKAGEDFDTLMNELSEDPGLASYPDGYTFGKGEMVEAFEEAAFALKENEVSELVTTDFGIHIIKRVPLTLSDTDIQTEKQTLQTKMFEEDILNKAKRIKIMYNDALISTIDVVKY